MTSPGKRHAARLNVRWVLDSHPQGNAAAESLRREEVPVPELGDGEILVRTVYLSVDPYHLQLMDAPIEQVGLDWETRTAVLEPVPLGGTMRGSAVGVVVESRDARFVPGEAVEGYLGYQTLVIARGSGDGTPNVAPLTTSAQAAGAQVTVGKIDPQVAPIQTRLNALGENGLTAHVGLMEAGRPRPGETVFVTSAAGSVGSVVGQVAKVMGCRVVGSAGSATKRQLCTDEFGYDAAIDYRADDVSERIDEACPDGIDVFVDLVGGAFSDLVFSKLNVRGRVALIGAHADYWADTDLPEHRGPRIWWPANFKQLSIQGFVLWDYEHLYDAYMRRMHRWWAEGVLTSREHIYQGIETAPQALSDIYEGRNIGKTIVQVSDDPFA